MAGHIVSGTRIALAQAQAIEARTEFATPVTTKSDRLAPADPAARKADALPTPARRGSPANVETVTGILMPPPSFLLSGDAEVGAASNAALSGSGTAPANATGDIRAPLSPPSEPAPSYLPPGNPAPPKRAAGAAAPTDRGGGEGEVLWSNKSAAPTPGPSGDASHQTGAARNLELAVPVRDGSFYLGDVGARISPRNTVSLAKDRLVQIAAPLLRPAALDLLKSVADSEGYLPLPALAEKGFDIRYDPQKVELQFLPSLDQRAAGKLSASRRRDQVRSENIVEPATVAGYVNMRAGADYSSRPFREEDGTANARIAFDGAVRWADLVFESAATFDIEQGFTRGASRFVYDMPDDALRLSAGDVTPLKSDLQGGTELLGISIEKSYQKLQPGANIRPTGSRSFRIDRPSNVDVMLNGHVMQRLHLRPGDYNLDDLPLTTGANDISLMIEDDVGQKRTLDFTIFSGRALLAPGISEWALSAGVASRYGSSKPSGLHNFYSDLQYDVSTPVVTGFYQRGLTPDITGNIHLQGEPDAVMGGAGAAFQTAFGFWVVDGAVSGSGDDALGYAGTLGYELANVQGKDGVSRSFRLVADYRSERFGALAGPDAFNTTMLDVSAVYSQPLAWDLAGSISGNYAVARGASPDRYGLDISLTRSFGPSLSAGFSAGYVQALGPPHDGDAEDGFTASLRLSYRVDETSSIDASHDLRGERSRLAYRHQEGTGVGSWSTQVELAQSGALAQGQGDSGINGAFGYIANRAELSVSHHSGLAGLDTAALDQRSSVTAGTALAFADGRFAVGRPVSNGFAIVGAHDSLAESDVVIGGSRESRQGSTGLLGPALVSDMSPYSPSRVAYDVDKLPVGYDLGAGTFDLQPAYKSGYRLTVGSDYTVTGFGTLLDEKGEPVALLMGTAVQDGGDAGHKVSVFTNRSGRFGVQGLRPGRWLLDMATEPATTRYVIDIPKDAVGLVKLETLRPAKAAP
jgi:outer membrane usher protein